MRNSFTLVEMMIVVIIIGILVGLGAPTFMQSQMRAVDREAQTNLKLIQTAQEVRRLETNNYVNCANNAACNAALRLDLPPRRADGGNWDYSVDMAGTPVNFRVRAVGDKGTSNWQIFQGSDDFQSF